MDGPTCDRCTPLNSDQAIASFITGPDGKFTLQNVPVGNNIPLIVQLGRWRRQITINVTACTNNALAAGTVRLPRNKGEGDIPLTAISTGDGTLLPARRRASTAELPTSGNGRIRLYQTNGARINNQTPGESTLRGNAVGNGDWNRYDQVIFPCRGSQVNESSIAQQNFLNYVNGGGRAFATHFSYTWLYQNGALANTAGWQVNQGYPNDPLTGTIDTTLQKGKDFAAWLGLVGALSERPASANPHRNPGTTSTASTR